MMKSLWQALLLVLTTASATYAATSTNVLQNINFQFTVYSQGTAAGNGKKFPDVVTSYSTKTFITALQQVTGMNFGNGAKLVLSTVYSNLAVSVGTPVFSNISSTNVPLPGNDILVVGGDELYGAAFGNTGTTVMSNESIISGSGGALLNNTISVVVPNQSTNGVFMFNTNAGYVTTLTPSVDAGVVTNIQILTQQVISGGATSNAFTNVGSSIDILYNGNANTLYPVTNYISFYTNSPEIVSETGAGLDTTNGVVSSQMGFSISNMQVSYFTTAQPNNLNIYFTGFVKQSLRLDTLSRGLVEYVYGASSAWNVVGSGYTGGGFLSASNSPPANAIPVANYVGGNYVVGYLTNSSPVIAEGSVTISFLKNLPQ